MNHAILALGGTVMHFVGDAVMAVLGAPLTPADHAERAVAAALAMHSNQDDVNRKWEKEGLEPFGLGIGLSTDEVAAACLGSEERIEYTLVGETVNLAQRLQQWAEPGETVPRAATCAVLQGQFPLEPLEPRLVKARGLLFEVADDGAGFDAAASSKPGAGFVNMADRLGAIGGSLSVESALGRGTKISGRIPVQAS